MLTTFITHADVTRHTRALTLLQDLRHAFEHHPVVEFDAQPVSQGPTAVRISTGTQHPAQSVTVRQTLSKGDPRATLSLFEAPSKKLLAVMDAGHLLTLQASLVAALSVDLLARETASRVAIIGDGFSASGALKALRLIRTINRFWLYGTNLADSTEQAFKLQKSLSASIRSTETLDEALLAAEIIVITGPVDLSRATIRKGTHVSVMGGPVRWPAGFEASQFVDSPRGGTWLGDVIAGRKPGRTSDDEITVFTSDGAVFLDVVTAWHVYFGARSDEALTRLDLES